MKKIIITSIVFFLGLTCLGQRTGEGWFPLRNKVEVRDTFALNKPLMLDGATSGFTVIKTDNIAGGKIVIPGSSNIDTLISRAEARSMLGAIQDQIDTKAPIHDAGLTGTTDIAKLQVGNASSNTKAEIDSMSFVDDEIADFVGSDTTKRYIPYADRTNLTDVVGTGKLQFIVDTTTYAPEAGDSLCQQDAFIEKHVEVDRNGLRQYRNATGSPQWRDGYRFKKETGTLTFKPVFSTNEEIIIYVTDSTLWTDLTMDEPPGFPQIETGTQKGSNSDPTYNHSITMPVGAQVGDLILVYFACDGDEVFTINEGVSGLNWTIEDQEIYSTYITGGVIWKIAEGSDALTLTTGNLEESSFVSYRISGIYASNPITVTVATGSSTNFDPPENTGEYGAVNYLWMVFAAADCDVVASVAPADFNNLVTQFADHAIGSASCSIADREHNTGGAYNPGTFTSDTEQWVCFTIIVNPEQ